MTGPAEEGSNKRRIWLWLGGGCAVVLLIGAILLLFGVYKGVTCCQDALEKQRRARAVTVEFAELIRDGDIDPAFQQLTPETRQGMSREDFGNRIEAYRQDIDETVPVLLTVRQTSQQAGGDTGNYWKAGVGFMPRQGETFVVLKLRLAPYETKGRPRFHVEKFDFERRKRQIEAEPPAAIVRRFHENLTEKDQEPARRLLAGGRRDAGAAGGVWSVVRSHAEKLATGNIEVVAVRYRPEATAEVDVRDRSVSDDQLRVRYRLERRDVGWRIVDVAIDPADWQAPEADEERPESEGPDAGGKDTASSAGNRGSEPAE